MSKRSVLACLMVATALTASISAFAQRRGGYRNSACSTNWDRENYFVSPFFSGNPLYDGRITFARIKYQGDYECGSEGPGWSYDYPRTETHFMQILKEPSSIHPFVSQGAITGSIVVRLDQSDIFRYAVAYLSEPGGWNLTDGELKGLQKYIGSGGFVIFDDIEGDPNPDYRNLLLQWRRAFPNAVPIKLDDSHRIFNTFFNIDLSKIPSKTGRYQPEYMGFFEDNDPNKRMLAVIDNYADIGEFIEFSDEGYNVVPANEAYKLWVNNFVYALTH